MVVSSSNKSRKDWLPKCSMLLSIGVGAVDWGPGPAVCACVTTDCACVTTACACDTTAWYAFFWGTAMADTSAGKKGGGLASIQERFCSLVMETIITSLPPNFRPLHDKKIAYQIIQLLKIPKNILRHFIISRPFVYDQS